MRDMFIVVAALLTVTSGLPYIIDIAKGKTHPNLVTWVTWMLVAGINAAAAFDERALATAVQSSAIVITDIFIIGMSLKKGVKRYTVFDVGCQVIALIGLILWLLTGDPSLAVALAVAVVVIAALPTWRHAWIAPFEETWQGFAMGGAGSVLTISGLTQFNFVSLAFPVAATINCFLMVGIILGRRTKRVDTISS